jgi:hypothetical protein
MGVIRDIDCRLAWGENDDGRCVWCGDALKHGREMWCSTDCYRGFAENHFWAEARAAARARDGFTCVRCVGLPFLRQPTRREFGWDYRAFDFALTEFDQEVRRRELEVNHIAPRNGKGYKPGCHHHLTNLETLCHLHHVGETAVQRHQRTSSAPLAAQQQLLVNE